MDFIKTEILKLKLLSDDSIDIDEIDYDMRVLLLNDLRDMSYNLYHCTRSSSYPFDSIRKINYLCQKLSKSCLQGRFLMLNYK